MEVLIVLNTLPSNARSTSAGGLKPPTSIPEGVVVAQNGSAIAAVISGSTASKSTAGLTDVINIESGNSGVVEFLSIGTAAVSVTASELKITVDGIVVYDRTGAIGLTNQTYIPIGMYDSGQAGGLGQYVFDNSLRVEYASDGTNPVYVTYKYYLT
jgi:hypothetical protein